MKVDPGELDPKSPATVEVTIDVEPDFELPEYEKFELDIQPIEINEDDVANELQSLCDQRASFEVVERKAEKGDYVKCSYEGKMGEVLVAELVPDKPMYGKQSNTWEEAGQEKGLGVDAIAQAIIGMAKNEKTEICISTTGIAGPNGGTKDKPIGLVYIGLKKGKKLSVTKCLFGKKQRYFIQNSTVKKTLRLINSLV